MYKGDPACSHCEYASQQDPPQALASGRAGQELQCAAASALLSAAGRRRGGGGREAPQGGAVPTPQSYLRVGIARAGAGSSCAEC